MSLDEALEDFAEMFVKAIRIQHMQEAAFAVCEHCRSGCEFTNENRKAHYVTNSNKVVHINTCKAAEIYAIVEK